MAQTLDEIFQALLFWSRGRDGMLIPRAYEQRPSQEKTYSYIAETEPLAQILHFSRTIEIVFD